ncbi:hypothetical protein GP486_000684 [Trichoglossum hirsutum]|uniref:Uncharacterized protein n=1 Tax=Trichoglossum hirsutum TaxID=265104 RepID=A0A9P8LIB4_9PEZI|nr:hypothetical protein GP486_000684 [Trichoglossum hirsutum]
MLDSTVISKQDGVTYIPLVIVGAGESGIAMGCRLKQVLGFDQFRIFERQSDIGGTWWINTYPGIACDIPASFYSFSFAPNYAWTTVYPGAKEILQYLQGVCEKFRIVDKIQLNTEVSAARWLEEEELWEATITHLTPGSGDLSDRDRKWKIETREQDIVIKRETVRCKVLISAVGGLVEPNALPHSVPGWEAFEGKVFHSARWDHNVDFTDKAVVVVGSGCSATQFVPRLTKAPYNAKSVTQVMRSPPWLLPAPEPPFGRKTWETWTPTVFTYLPAIGWFFRQVIAATLEYDWRLFGDSEYSKREREKYEKKLLAHLYKTAPEKYHKILTPNYGVCCKRRVIDTEWLACLNDPKVELTTLKLNSVQSHGVILGPGSAYPPTAASSSGATPGQETLVAADIIVVANGFDTAQWLHRLKLTGKNSVTLHDEWSERGGPRAYNGTSMDGFPNFFMLFGPNTATGHSSVILASEQMVNYSLKFIKPILEGDVSQVEVKREAQESYTRDIQEKLKNTVFMGGGCVSWYKSENGWNSTVYPYSQLRFGWRSMYPTYTDWNFKYTSKGYVKLWLRGIAKLILSIVAVASVYKASQAGYSASNIQRNIWDFLKMGLDMLGRLTAMISK